MSAPEPLFDTRLLRHRLRRAARAPATFLLDRTADDLAERLDTIRRDFRSIADVGTPNPSLARRIAERYPEARLVRVAPFSSDPADRRNEELSTIGDPERLALAAESLDLAVSAFSLQAVSDLPGALVQIRMALKPDGLFLGAMLGGRTLHELRSALIAAEGEILGGVSPRVAPFADVRDMGGLLQRAGFALPVADSETLTVRYDHLFALMADLRAMGATNAMIARSRRPTPRALFLRAAEHYRQRFADSDGRVRATFEIVSLSGWAPHASQQAPARRGSGQVSLAAILGGAKT